MKSKATRMFGPIAVAAVACGIACGRPAQAAGEAPAYAAGASNPIPPAPALDPALRRELDALRGALLADLGAALANGSLDGFDPGRALEQAIGRALSSAELGALIDRLLAQPPGPGSAADMPPEMRAFLGLAIRGLIASARREFQREGGREGGRQTTP